MRASRKSPYSFFKEFYIEGKKRGYKFFVSNTYRQGYLWEQFTFDIFKLFQCFRDNCNIEKTNLPDGTCGSAKHLHNKLYTSRDFYGQRENRILDQIERASEVKQKTGKQQQPIFL